MMTTIDETNERCDFMEFRAAVKYVLNEYVIEAADQRDFAEATMYNDAMHGLDGVVDIYELAQLMEAAGFPTSTAVEIMWEAFERDKNS